ncbi:response regulator transcription factor [Puteibacter caeruleilacunae]|nr:response regulator transcription factor [Puteibacter caeruleilacunae]
MITALIIDDEQNGRDNLANLVKQHCNDIHVIGTAEDIPSALKLIEGLKPQLLFLDIQLKDGTGFDILNQCPTTSFEVIFVTAYDQYGLHAIRFSAIDYILKPIDHELLSDAVDKAIKQIELKIENKRLRNLLHNNSQQNGSKRIALPFVDSIEFVEVKDIIRLEAEGSYTRFFTINGKEMLISGSLKEYVEMLTPYGFIRTHQAHFVNPDFIKSFVKADGGYLKLQNGDTVPISRLRKNEILQTLRD